MRVNLRLLWPLPEASNAEAEKEPEKAKKASIKILCFEKIK
jgi:hypothetical protein